jgi:hypothetical protein
MKKDLSYFFRSFTDFIFRKRTAALVFAKIGGSLVGLSAVASLVVSVTYQGQYGFFEIEYHSSSTPKLIILISFVLGASLIFISLAWELIRYRSEYQILKKRKTIVIEQRGLVDTKDESLAEHVRKTRKIQVDSILVDIRERLIDNVISEPEIALDKVFNLKHSLKEKTNSLDVSDINVIYGGIMPVPFAFLTGYLLDDESSVEIIDWDRDASAWRELDSDDDSEQFRVDVENQKTCNGAVIAVSFSYPVDKAAINSAFPSLPHHYLSLNDVSRNNHWSKQKQSRLAGEFFEYCKNLAGQGVEHIHLILASQNSVAFRFGQIYDKRNLPSITVYQYERSHTLKYPWGVRIPQQPKVKPYIKTLELSETAII